MNEIELNKRIIKARSDGVLQIESCSLCQSVVLSNIDTDDTLYFKCLGCNRISRPGLSLLRKFDERMSEFGY